ncbi:MAG: hypothetical protein AAGM67_10430 [Bacteroidota bacterium]
MIKVQKKLYINPDIIAMVSEEPDTGDALIYFKKPLYFKKPSPEQELDSIETPDIYAEEMEMVPCISVAKESSAPLWKSLDNLARKYLTGVEPGMGFRSEDDDDDDDIEVIYDASEGEFS